MADGIAAHALVEADLTGRAALRVPVADAVIAFALAFAALSAPEDATVLQLTDEPLL